MSDIIGIAAIAFVAGWQWCDWWSSRRVKKELGGDAGLKLLAGMAMQIADRRKMVGDSLVIRASHRFETPAETYTLTLEADAKGLIGEGEAA